MPRIPYISFDEMDPLLDWNQLTDALLAGHQTNKARISDQFITRGQDTLLSRAAWIDGMGVAVKSVTVFPENAHKNLPSVHGAMLLFEDKTGRVEAIIDSALVTKWKTAADSLLAAKLLARPDSKQVLIVGTGKVAQSLVDAYRAWLPLAGISVWGRDFDKAQGFAGQQGIAAVKALEPAVKTADIISCATMSSRPVIMGEWLQAGQHLDLIGAFKADMREADDAALRRARIFVDSRETTLDHIGELKIPLQQGVIKRRDILGDFYDLSNGSAARQSAADITLFKNGGGAHLDLMTSRYMLDKWQANL
ncbi:MAG: ornithine cyclodeaminase [Rhodobacteraceae bacterium]|nr:ornithine cyclodeaminase [Paracoccaceae bacterium]